MLAMLAYYMATTALAVLTYYSYYCAYHAHRARSACLQVTNPPSSGSLHYRYITVTLPLHYRYIYRFVTAALPLHLPLQHGFELDDSNSLKLTASLDRCVKPEEPYFNKLAQRAQSDPALAVPQPGPCGSSARA